MAAGENLGHAKLHSLLLWRSCLQEPAFREPPSTAPTRRHSSRLTAVAPAAASSPEKAHQRIFNE